MSEGETKSDQMETIQMPDMLPDSVMGDMSSAGFDERTKSQFESLKEYTLGYYTKLRECSKPWAEFAHPSSISKPDSIGEAGKRVYVNIFKYQGNYIVLVTLLILYSILTNIWLILGIIGGMGTHVFFATKRNPHSGNVVIFGKELTLAQQYGTTAAITVPLLFFGSAGSVIFWLIGASVVLVLVHASCIAVDSVKLFDDPA